MMTKNKIIMGIAVFGSMIAPIAHAQQSDIAKQRFIMDEAISTIEDYETFATIADEEIRYSFENLFVNENATIYNDLLGISKGGSLTVKEYAKSLSEGLRNKKATIKNIKKERVWNENGVWKVRFAFDKAMSYTNKCGVYFSSTEFYDKEYHLAATLVYDESANKCKIESITGNVNSSKKLPDTYFVFKSDDQRDYQLSYQNKKLAFNSYGQALLEGAYDKNAFRYSDPDVELTPVFDECNNVSMKYKARKFRIKLHYDLGLGEALDLADVDGLNNHKTSSFSFGVDFGYVFPSKSSVKTGLFVGLGMSQSTIETAFQTSDYSYSTDADVDGDEYTRHYTDLSLSQKAKLTELSIPVYADFNIKLHHLVSLYFDLGVKANVNISHAVDNTEGSAYIYGNYPQYGNLRMDEHWGYNGFGEKTFSDSDLDNKDLVGVSSFTADAFGGVGLRFNIPSTSLSVDVGANYQFGLIDVIKSEGAKIGLTNNTSSPFVYNTVSGLSSSEHIRNLVEASSSVKRKSLKLSVGLIYKF